jgi:hypothetical protein
MLVSRRSSTPGGKSRGQVLVIFVGSLVVLFGILAVVIDVSWYWANSLRVQRAADAAALAGVVNLPGNVPGAGADARAEAVKNGYDDDNVGPDDAGVIVTPAQDGSNPRRLNVRIQAQVPTYFMRIFGMNSIAADRNATAEFVLPVPMGSPQNYYGIGCLSTNVMGGRTQATCTTAGNSNGPSGVPNSVTGSAQRGGTAPSQLASQGFWGVAFTKGGDSRNGDAFLPTQISGPTVANPDYDLSGYGYTVEIPSGSTGTVSLFDPGFCAMPVLGSGRAGTGDEWTGNMGGSNPASVTTYFNLYRDALNTPFKLSDDTFVWASGSLFENMRQVDQSGAHGTGAPQYAAGGNGVTRCDRPTDPNFAYHLRWWPIPVALSPGTYRLQVTTTKVNTATGGGTVVNDATVNSTVGAANRFGIEVTASAGSPRVYGGGRMASYANIQSGTQRFYLAQIDAIHAGKSMQIDLFDPGDVGGGAFLEVMSPDNPGNLPAGSYSYQPTTFSYTSRSKSTGAAGPSENNVQCIQTNRASGAPPGGAPAGSCLKVYDNSGSRFDGYWLTITVPLPSNYGANGLIPIGESQSSWWKIQYRVAGGNDTTTWQVSIIGNPVHLVVP